MRRYWAGTKKEPGGYRARVWEGMYGKGAMLVWVAPALVPEQRYARRLADKVAAGLTAKRRSA